MNKKNQIKILMVIAALASASIFCSRFTDSGDDTLAKSDVYGQLFDVVGNVKLRSADSEKLSDAQEEDKVYLGDQILTFDDSRVRMNLSNGTIIRLSPQSTFVLQEIEGSEDNIFAQLYLEVGEIWIILNGGSINVDTPSGVASVRGSYLHVIVKPNDTVEITCLEGKCSIGNRGGTVNLVAGQTALVTGITNPPQSKIMSHQDVRDWLLANPEATAVIMQLTKTVAALEVDAPPIVQSPTQSPTFTVTSDITLTPSKTLTATITPTATGIVCGPSSDWVGYFVQQGDSLEDLANAYQIPISILQFANCMSDQTYIAKGYHIYVPDHATVTPTPTITPTRTKTPTPVPVVVVAATATLAPTITPTNSPAAFKNPVGPTGTLLNCNSNYSIDVSEPDGIASVKIMYALNDPTIATPSYISLTQNGSFPNTYEGTINIDTFNPPAATNPDTVYYHYKVTDSQGQVTYEPGLGSPYLYADSLDCGSPTNVTIIKSPLNGGSISVCGQDYSVGVVDPDVVTKVKMEYSINDNTFAASTFQLFTATTPGSLYDLTTFTIPATAGDIIFWRLEAFDTRGDLAIKPVTPPPYSFTSITCP